MKCINNNYFSFSERKTKESMLFLSPNQAIIVIEHFSYALNASKSHLTMLKSGVSKQDK